MEIHPDVPGIVRVGPLSGPDYLTTQVLRHGFNRKPDLLALKTLDGGAAGGLYTSTTFADIDENAGLRFRPTAGAQCQASGVSPCCANIPPAFRLQRQCRRDLPDWARCFGNKTLDCDSSRRFLELQDG